MGLQKEQKTSLGFGKRSSRDELVLETETAAVGGFAERAEAAEDELVLNKEMAAVGGFAKGTVGSDRAGVDLAGPALPHDTIVSGWLAFASSAFVWSLTEFLLRGFFKTSLQELFLFAPETRKTAFSAVSAISAQTGEAPLQSPNSAVGPSSESHPGAWKAFRVFLLKISKNSFFFLFLKRSHI